MRPAQNVFDSVLEPHEALTRRRLDHIPPYATLYVGGGVAVTLPLPSGGDQLTWYRRLLSQNWLKPRPEHGLDWLVCSNFKPESWPLYPET